MTASVLLIEANTSIVAAVTCALNQSTAWQLTLAGSLADAQGQLARASFDLVLCGHPLPDGGCLDLAGTVSGRPLLLLVEPDQEWMAARALQAGFAGYALRAADGSVDAATLLALLRATYDRSQQARLAMEHRRHVEWAIEGANVGLWDWDAGSDSSTVNAQWTAMLGHTPDEISMRGKDWMLWVHPDDVARIEQAVDASFKRRTTQYDVEFRMRHKLGHWVWIQSRGKVVEVAADGTPLRVAGTQVDITERKQAMLSLQLQHSLTQAAQEENRASTQLLAQKTQAMHDMLNSVSQGISLVSPDNHIVAYNARYLELLDLPESLVAPLPPVETIVRFQKQRGDFGESFELIDAAARDYVASENAGVGAQPDMPDIYLRKSRAGRVIEIRTRRLPNGGRVRTFTDVSSYLASQSALRESEARFRSLTELITDWYWEQDADGRFTMFEASRKVDVAADFSSLLGKTAEQCSGVLTFNASETQWQEWQALLTRREELRDFVFPVRFAGQQELRYFAVSALPMVDDRGGFIGYRGTGRDVTDRKNAEAEIERLAFYDALCNLPNRRLLVKRLSQALASSYRSNCHGSILFIDLDNFKDLNDTLGHAMGDTLLKQVARRLVDGMREGDTVARFGGDEFVVMIENLSPDLGEATAQAGAIGRKLMLMLNQPYDLHGIQHHSTPSIGATVFCGHYFSVDELLKRADMAMYQAKAAGRNVLRFFDPEMQAEVAARSAIEADLRSGLQRDELRLFYQPIVDIDWRLIGVEALLRWQHPSRGLVSPAEFVPIAERSGLILPLGQWVLQAACSQLASWAGDPATEPLKISVNVSARQFRQPEFVTQVLAVLRQTGANPERLKIELTESMLLNDIEDVIDKMTQLQAHGVSFALDDFGTGYSSLAYLKRLPLDQLKIDQSFVRDVLTDPNDAAIARTILALAQSLDLSVVAEGVETTGQRDFLARSGCREFQGYLFGRPAPAEHVLENLLPASS